MHDIKAIRADPEAFDAGLRRRGVTNASHNILTLDARVREVKANTDELRARANTANTTIRGLIFEQSHIHNAVNENPELSELLLKLPALEQDQRTETEKRQEISRTIAAVESQGDLLAKDLDLLIGTIPNLPAPDVPDGLDETGNVVVHTRGMLPAFAFAPQEHDTLALRLGYDPEAAAAISGARFAVLKGPIARLHRALGQYMIDVHAAEFGYTEVAPPLLVRAEALFGVGQLPKFEADVFKTTDEPPRYLIPTAEASLTNLVREQILDVATLPLRFTALTPCFRSEAGSAGRDTRGLIRQHQFDKVELVSITAPDQAEAEHERMTECAEAILDRLGLPYRRMLLCAGDMGFSARKTYDLEVWLPGQGQYREISSCSDCGDFQARRMNTRFRAKGEKGTRGFVHTLNGSALAVGRTLVAVIENYQQADGSVTVPAVLAPYMAGVTALTPGS